MAAAAGQAIGSLGGTFFGYQGAMAELGARNAEASSILYDGVDAAKEHISNTQDLITTQKMKFIKSGVTLQGSPLLLMQQTAEQGKRDAAKIVRHSKEQAEVVMKGGRARVGAQIQTAFAQGASGLVNAYAGARSRAKHDKEKGV